jgi:hypothetical protein
MYLYALGKRMFSSSNSKGKKTLKAGKKTLKAGKKIA